jgi:hypothetical protein
MEIEHSTCFKGGTGESAANWNCGIISDPAETKETLVRGSTRTPWRTGSSYIPEGSFDTLWSRGRYFWDIRQSVICPVSLWAGDSSGLLNGQQVQVDYKYLSYETWGQSENEGFQRRTSAREIGKPGWEQDLPPHTQLGIAAHHPVCCDSRNHVNRGHAQ